MAHTNRWYVKKMMQEMREMDAAAAVERQARLAELAKARLKRRPKCRCAAYPWPHRPRSGFCRHPDPPLETWKGKPGTHRPVGTRRRGLARTLFKQYGLHPIRDRARIARIMPRLYAAWCKRNAPATWQSLKSEGRIDGRGRLTILADIA